MASRTATSGWPRGILFALRPTLLQPAWRWHRLSVVEPWQSGSGFPGTAAWSVGPHFVPADAHSSWWGLPMTCSSLEQHWGCCERVRGKGRTTPRNLTEPLWQGSRCEETAGTERTGLGMCGESLGEEQTEKQVLKLLLYNELPVQCSHRARETGKSEFKRSFWVCQRASAAQTSEPLTLNQELHRRVTLLQFTSHRVCRKDSQLVRL